jgi:hypothetical protein
VPQVVVPLGDAADFADVLASLQPAPLVIPTHGLLPLLICEVLHPLAHWTGSFSHPPAVEETPDPSAPAADIAADCAADPTDAPVSITGTASEAFLGMRFALKGRTAAGSTQGNSSKPLAAQGAHTLV